MADPKQDKAVAGAAKDVTSTEDRIAQLEVQLAEKEAALARAQSDANAKAQADADAQAAKDAESVSAERMDETVERGRYLVNGVYVDCDGKPLEK